jgi:hypothetical protein
MLRRVLGWEPKILLAEGLNITYKWIESEVRKSPKYAAQINRELTTAR